MMDVINDEVDLPEDEEGEKKVDKMGNLQGGRDYRVRIFTIKGRGDRQYMLSTEPARCCGFRDSYLFFTKHMQLYKIIIDDAEKRDLIDREIILGDSAAAHVRVRECPGAVILQATQDGLLCRADDTLSIDGRPAGRAAPVPDGARVVVGSLSFVVCRE